MRTEIDYLAPVRFPDVVEGRIWLADQGRAKWVLAAEFASQTLGASGLPATTARARQTGVFVSLATLRPVRLPEEFRLA